MSDGLILPAAVLFDMDGTLTEPMLDFPKIKAEMGIGNQPILEALAELSGREREEAEAVLLRHEEHAATQSHLNPGCRDVLAWLSDRRMPTALITRNSRLSAQTVLRKHHLSIEVLITREDGPFKPDPYPLKLACSRLSVDAGQAWMVGDGRYDVEAGIAAGIRTVWVSHKRPRPFAAQPTVEVEDLVQLHGLLIHCAGK